MPVLLTTSDNNSPLNRTGANVQPQQTAIGSVESKGSNKNRKTRQHLTSTVAPKNK